jgi:hypothetical protein
MKRHSSPNLLLSFLLLIGLFLSCQNQGPILDYDLIYFVNGEQQESSHVIESSHTPWDAPVAIESYHIDYSVDGISLFVHKGPFDFVVFSDSSHFIEGKVYDSSRNIVQYWPQDYLIVEYSMLSNKFIFEKTKDRQYGDLLIIHFDFEIHITMKEDYPNERYSCNDTLKVSEGLLRLNYNTTNPFLF